MRGDSASEFAEGVEDPVCVVVISARSANPGEGHTPKNTAWRDPLPGSYVTCPSIVHAPSFFTSRHVLSAPRSGTRSSSYSGMYMTWCGCEDCCRSALGPVPLNGREYDESGKMYGGEVEIGIEDISPDIYWRRVRDVSNLKKQIRTHVPRDHFILQRDQASWICPPTSRLAYDRHNSVLSYFQREDTAIFLLQSREDQRRVVWVRREPRGVVPDLELCDNLQRRWLSVGIEGERRDVVGIRADEDVVHHGDSEIARDCGGRSRPASDTGESWSAVLVPCAYVRARVSPRRVCVSLSRYRAGGSGL